MSVSFLSDVLTADERKRVGMSHPAERWWPVTDRPHARNAQLALGTVLVRDLPLDAADERVLAKLYGALYALYPELQ